MFFLISSIFQSLGTEEFDTWSVAHWKSLVPQLQSCCSSVKSSQSGIPSQTNSSRRHTSPSHWWYPLGHLKSAHVSRSSSDSFAQSGIPSHNQVLGMQLWVFWNKLHACTVNNELLLSIKSYWFSARKQFRRWNIGIAGSDLIAISYLNMIQWS